MEKKEEGFLKAWQCTGPCQEINPRFGVLWRLDDRAPSCADDSEWWMEHNKTCGGSFFRLPIQGKVTVYETPVQKVRVQKKRSRALPDCRDLKFPWPQAKKGRLSIKKDVSITNNPSQESRHPGVTKDLIADPWPQVSEIRKNLQDLKLQ